MEREKVNVEGEVEKLREKLEREREKHSASSKKGKGKKGHSEDATMERVEEKLDQLLSVM